MPLAWGTPWELAPSWYSKQALFWRLISIPQAMQFRVMIIPGSPKGRLQSLLWAAKLEGMICQTPIPTNGSANWCSPSQQQTPVMAKAKPLLTSLHSPGGPESPAALVINSSNRCPDPYWKDACHHPSMGHSDQLIYQNEAGTGPDYPQSLWISWFAFIQAFSMPLGSSAPHHMRHGIVTDQMITNSSHFAQMTCKFSMVYKTKIFPLTRPESLLSW